MVIFTKDNLTEIVKGEKIETRRIWKTPHVRVGGTYPLRSSRFAPVPPDAPRITVDALYLQPLGIMTPEAAAREGCKSLDEFRDLWIRLHGSWEPGREVWVVRFHLVGNTEEMIEK